MLRVKACVKFKSFNSVWYPNTMYKDECSIYLLLIDLGANWL